MNTQRALLTLEIDRVADFINNSRKTQDAWLGSYLISYIMSSVAVKAESLGDIKYPLVADIPLFVKMKQGSWPAGCTDDEKRVSGFPDRMMLEVDLNQAEAIAKQLQDTANDAWKTVWSASRDRLHTAYSQLAVEAQWREQCDRYFTLHWAAVPIETTFEAAYDRNCRLLYAVNRSRPMAVREQPGHKCTLCGNLSALPIDQRGYVSLWKRLFDSRRFGRLFAKNERLSAVFAAKRLAGWAKVGELMEREGAAAFPSLMSVASAQFRSLLIESGTTTDIQAFREKLAALHESIGLNENEWQEAGIPRHKRLAGDNREKLWLAHLDGEWLYKDNYSLTRIMSEYGVEGGEGLNGAVSNAKQALMDLIRNVRQARAAAPELREWSLPTSPTAYYAVLAADGDDMTKLMAQPQRWPEVTSALSSFAQTVVPQVVHGEHSGQLEYSGGDELIAFLPVDDVLPVLIKLRHTFPGDDPNPMLTRMGLEQTSVTNLHGLGGTTMSAGVAIAHCRTSLRLAITAAQAALQRAKHKYSNKNRIEISVLKRSGAPVVAGWVFSPPNAHIGPEVLLAMSIDLCKRDWLSRKFFRDVIADAQVIGSQGVECAEADTERLLKRHFPTKEKPERVRARSQYLEILNQVAIGQIGLSDAAPLFLFADWLAKEG